MRRRLLTLVALAVTISMISQAGIGPASAVAEESMNTDQSPWDRIQEDPYFQQEASKILQLKDEAAAGSSLAQEQLGILSSLYDLHPRAWLTSSAWEVFQLKKDKLGDWIPDAPPFITQAAGAAGLAPVRTATSFSSVYLVSRDQGVPIQTEPHMCSNPENRYQLTMAATEYGMPGNSIYVSPDAGETWRGPIWHPLMNRTTFAADPVTACGRDDYVHLTFISLGSQTFLLGPYPIGLTRSDIAVSTSPDNGYTWNQPTLVATNRVEENVVPVRNPVTGRDEGMDVTSISFLDKPWMSIGPNPKDPTKDVLYVSYTEFVEYFSIVKIQGVIYIIPVQTTSSIVIHASEDNGATWTEIGNTPPLIALSEQTESIEDTTIRQVNYVTVQGSQVGVADDGTLYVSWYDSTEDGFSQGSQRHMITATNDFGENWRPITVIAESLEVYRRPRSVFFRNSSSASTQMVINTADGQNEILLVFASRVPERPEDDGDINFVRGIDNGTTIEFTEPIRLNGDDTNRLQFFPAIAVDDNDTPEGDDDVIHVFWGDMRDDPANMWFHQYYTKSTDHGETWGFENRGFMEADARVTDAPSNPNRAFPRGRFIGDYVAIVICGDNEACMVFPSSILATYGGIDQRIAFSRTMARLAPAITISPRKGPALEQVSVTVSHLQPDMPVSVSVGNASNWSFVGLTDKNNGSITFGITIPLGLSDDNVQIFVRDATGLNANISYTIEEGLDGIVSSGLASQLATDAESKTDGGVSKPVVGLLLLAAGTAGAGAIWFVTRRGRSRQGKQ